MNPTEHQSDVEKCENPADLGVFLQRVIESFEEPKPGAQNVMHFQIGGTSIAKAVPWISEDGEVIGVEPQWIGGFRNPLTHKADFVERLPVGTDDKNLICEGVRYVQNPITGEKSYRYVPWYEGGQLVLARYVPGIQVSRGARISYEHNPEEEFEMPGDVGNLMFFQSGARRGPDRAVSDAFTEIKCRRDSQEGRLYEGKNIPTTVVIGANFGGTIMMEREDEGLVPRGSLEKAFKSSLQEKFPNICMRDYSFSPSKVVERLSPAFGIDSSQVERDFVADLANSLVCAWNELRPEEREHFSGFVLSLGTDTAVQIMSELKMMLGPNCPFSVVGVGAMKALVEESSEAHNSLLKAFETLEELHKHRYRTIALRAEGGLYNPLKTVKVSDKIAAAFQGAKLIDTDNFETVKTAIDRDRFAKRYENEKSYEYNDAVLVRGESKVFTIGSQLSENLFELEDAIRRSGAGAILIESYASFTKPMNVIRAAKRAAGNRPVFCVNPILGGDVTHEYQPALLLKEEGVIPLSMTSHAARAKLNYGIKLFGTRNLDAVADFMTKNDFVGEQVEGFTPYDPDQLKDLEFLRNSVRAAHGITPELKQYFDSPDFVVNAVRGNVESVYTGELREGTNLMALYGMNQVVDALNYDQLIDLIEEDEGLVWGLKVVMGEEVVDRLLEIRTLSKVRPQGMPIDLKIAA